MPTDINYESERFMFQLFKTQKTLHGHITHAAADRKYASLGEKQIRFAGSHKSLHCCQVF